MDHLHPSLLQNCQASVEAWGNPNLTILPGGTGFIVYDFTNQLGILRQSTTELDPTTRTISRDTRVFWPGHGEISSDGLDVIVETLTGTTHTIVKTQYILDGPVRATNFLSWEVNQPSFLSRTSSLYTKLTTVKENGIVTSKFKEYWFPGMQPQRKVLVPRTPEELLIDGTAYETDEEDGN